SACPPGTYSVSASVSIANQLSHAVEFRIGLLEGTELVNADAFVQEQLSSKLIVARSAWHRLIPHQTAQVHARSDVKVEGPGSILLATRMADNCQNSYAWARFSDIRVSLSE